MNRQKHWPHFLTKQVTAALILTVLLICGSRTVLADAVFSPIEIISDFLLDAFPVILLVIVVVVVTVLILIFRSRKKKHEKKEAVYEQK